MDKKKRSKPSDLSCIEDWMNQFFTDPFSALLDCRSFRVDLFETSEEYIVEAEFAEVKPEDIQIRASRETLIITAQTAGQTTESDQLERSVLLPFSLENKKIEAIFSNDILEVKIFKEGSCSRKSSYIPVQFAH